MGKNGFLTPKAVSGAGGGQVQGICPLSVVLRASSYGR
jgi:hypothetical protein